MLNSDPGDFHSIPIITVGGFLGAGKTTLVNHLLSQSDGKRIVVFVNDFGAINIDYDLIETADTDRISLSNGCVCCSLNDDLITSISEFCTTAPPDAFVVEASGVADPRALDQSIATLQRSGRVRLACRVYVLDADHFVDLDYAETEQIVDHAVASDLTLLNKWDLADNTALEGIEVLLRRSAPQTIMRRTYFCQVSLVELLNVTTHLSTSNVNSRSLSTNTGTEYISWSCEDFAPISRARFDLLIDELLGTVVRAKGLLYFEENPDKAMKFDLVGKRHVLTPYARSSGKRHPKFVAIGWTDKLLTANLSNYFVQDCVTTDHSNSS